MPQASHPPTPTPARVCDRPCAGVWSSEWERCLDTGLTFSCERYGDEEGCNAKDTCAWCVTACACVRVRTRVHLLSTVCMRVRGCVCM